MDILKWLLSLIQRKPIDTGFRPYEPTGEDFQLGAVGDKKVLMPDGHGWGKYLVEGERQNRGTETFSCVSQSANNCLEIQLKRIIELGEDKPLIAKLTEMGYIRNGEVNFSDRFTAKMSGTTRNGNNQKVVADSIRHNGLVPEWVWPHVEGWDNFYAPISAEVIAMGKKFADFFDTTYEFVTPAQMIEALKYNVDQTSGNAWLAPQGGIYRRTMNILNHAFVLFDYVVKTTKEIFDTYWDYGKENDYTKTLDWDYNLGWGLLYNIRLKKNFYNIELIQKLRKDGVDLIMRVEDKGQIYELTDEGLNFLDSEKNELTRHIPFLDYCVQKGVNNEAFKILPVNEENYKRISGE